jgi:hypothetical protein
MSYGQNRAFLAVNVHSYARNLTPVAVNVHRSGVRGGTDA